MECKCAKCGKIKEEYKAKLCAKCAKAIFGKEIDKTEYYGKIDVDIDRETVLYRAKEQGIKDPEVYSLINEHFDSKIEPGLIGIFKNFGSQELYVYEDRIEIRNGKGFSIDIYKDSYYSALGNEKFAEYEASSGEIETSLIKTAIKKKHIRDQLRLQMPFGTNYGDEAFTYDDINEFVVKHPTEEIGFIRFLVGDRTMLFFIEGNESKYHLKELENYIRQRLTQDKKPEVKRKTHVTRINSIADEIMKDKELLDIGAISEEEFTAKKKELLGFNYNVKSSTDHESDNSINLGGSDMMSSAIPILNESENAIIKKDEQKKSRLIQRLEEKYPDEMKGLKEECDQLKETLGINDDESSEYVKGVAGSFLKSGHYTAHGLYKAAKKEAKKEIKREIREEIKKML